MSRLIEQNRDRGPRDFPSSPKNRRPGGSSLSACLFALLGVFAAPAQAATLAEQVDQALRAHLQPQLQRETRQQGWQQPRLQLDFSVPASAQNLATCSQAPRVRSLSERGELLSRQRYQLTCAAPAWSFIVTSEAEVSVMLLVARRILNRDQQLSADDVKASRQSVGKQRQGFYGQVAEIEGLTAKRRIRAGQVLSPQLLGAPLLVRRGQQVTIVATQDGIEAAAKGVALSNGAAGDVIKVRNPSSEKVIEVQVTGEGVVSSTFR